MGKIKYNEMKKNSKLTDFSGIKEMVLAYQVKNVPGKLKHSTNGFDKQLGYYD